MRALTSRQRDLYAALRQSAYTDKPGFALVGSAMHTVARGLVSKRLARIDGHMIYPTAESVEFGREIAARRAARQKEAA